ncbi:MAG: hypothetical protein LBE12_19580 [Planctomycetaceae bacterium]|nr:hypothetical protein [Planctomycetaceae bacterium]
MQKQPFEYQNQKINRYNTIPFYSNTWFGLGLIICLLVSGYLWDSYISPKTIVTTTKIISVPKTSDQGSSGIKFAKIQDVQVGERAIGVNPELTDSERATFFPDPEPATWRKLTLEIIKSDGKRLDITLLRPLNWISESQADIGTTIFLDLPELGAQGLAKVLNIEPCPPIKSGKGNVITGTFHHEAANTIDLYVEGLSKPIGCTDNHPFWSVTRNEFIEAGKLLPGEELHLYSGQTAKIIQILPRPGPEQVHNIEVLNEHVYRVTESGILVHNACDSWFDTKGKIRRYDGQKPKYVKGNHPDADSGYGNPNKTPIPADAEMVFQKAVPNDPDNPTAWFGQNDQGEVYRFSGSNGEAHFNGIAGVGDGTRNLTQYALMRMEIERKYWKNYW